jgi:hypothetical protein
VTVTYGLIPGSDREIAMLTRSMLHIMVDMATQIDVPSVHVTEGRTVPYLKKPDGADEEIKRLMHIKNSPDKPDNAFTAVNYRGHWFWIDDRDYMSKRTFAFMMILFPRPNPAVKRGFRWSPSRRGNCSRTAILRVRAKINFALRPCLVFNKSVGFRQKSDR